MYNILACKLALAGILYQLHITLIGHSALLVNAERCNIIRERPEIHSMNVKQRNDFFQAVKALKKGPPVRRFTTGNEKLMMLSIIDTFVY
jgi:hypothetical protein